MIDRQSSGILPDKPHTVFRDEQGNLLYEEMHTRQGFEGAFSYFYHRYPPAEQLDPHPNSVLPPPVITQESDRFPLKRRLYWSDSVAASGSCFNGRIPFFTNSDITLFVVHANETDPFYFANGDGDELWYVIEGEALLESPCGWLKAQTGDYVWVPRSMAHRWHLRSSNMRALLFEAHSEVALPQQFRNRSGQIKMDAPYTHRDFVRPNGPISTLESIQDGPRVLCVKKSSTFTSYRLSYPAMDVVGWDGFVYPWAFSIFKFQPKTGLIHLPPTIHTTFAGPGFVVCSFVPRMTDFHPNAIPSPYPHASVHCDELILYLSGHFTSRKGIRPGALSLHPAGIAHGPHPGAYEASIGSRRTEELAVMIDTLQPLLPTKHAAACEDPSYHDSWRKPR